MGPPTLVLGGVGFALPLGEGGGSALLWLPLALSYAYGAKCTIVSGYLGRGFRRPPGLLYGPRPYRCVYNRPRVDISHLLAGSLGLGSYPSRGGL